MDYVIVAESHLEDDIAQLRRELEKATTFVGHICGSILEDLCVLVLSLHLRGGGTLRRELSYVDRAGGRAVFRSQLWWCILERFVDVQILTKKRRRGEDTWSTTHKAHKSLESGKLIGRLNIASLDSPRPALTTLYTCTLSSAAGPPPLLRPVARSRG